MFVLFSRFLSAPLESRLTLNTNRLNLRPSAAAIIKRIPTENISTTRPQEKLTSSYYHSPCSFPMVYKTVSQYFDQIADQYSDHECFVFKSEQKRYTYKTFKEEVDCIAAALLDLGFEKNDRFAVWLANMSENVVISYAVSKLGLIKVNINPAYVDRELDYCLNKVGCKGILLSPTIKSLNLLSTFRHVVPEIEQQSASNEGLTVQAVPTLKHVILTGAQTDIPGVHSYTDLLRRGAQLSHKKLLEQQASIDPDAPIEIFFTSGTTGQPKAATLTSFGVLNLIRSQYEHIGHFFTRLCIPIPMFHIFSAMVGVLTAAVSKCHITFPDVLPNTVATMRAIHEEKCTAIIGAPVIFRDILMHTDRPLYDLSSLVFGMAGASPMNFDFLRQVENEFPIQRMAQAYGMTETTGIITSGMWAGDNDSQRRLTSAGRPMPGLEIKIVDQQGNTLPIGQAGEIWIRSYTVMREYYNDIEKTREAITPARWFRTGDDGRMDEDGFIFLLGRQKEMINRGGVKIYPTDVENTILEHPHVAEAQVFSIPDERYDEEVCAWIRLKPSSPQCEPDDIRTFLRGKLAFFKIPKYIRIVDKFITTTTGKVQKFKMSEMMVNDLKQMPDKN